LGETAAVAAALATPLPLSVTLAGVTVAPLAVTATLPE
jgi:hypothetical protein